MAHASYAHQVRPVTRLTPRRRASDWPLMPRLSLMAGSSDRSITGRIYDRTDAVTSSPDHSLDTGRSPYTVLARSPTAEGDNVAVRVFDVEILRAPRRRFKRLENLGTIGDTPFVE